MHKINAKMKKGDMKSLNNFFTPVHVKGIDPVPPPGGPDHFQNTACNTLSMPSSNHFKLLLYFLIKHFLKNSNMFIGEYLNIRRKLFL